jgi:hypothetical protein
VAPEGGLTPAEQQRALDDFRHREADGSSRRGRLLLSSPTGEHPVDIEQWPEPFIGRVFELPPATAEDFGRVDRAERLRTPEAWQEWLGEYTGREAWAEDPSGAMKVPETNFMARAAVGDTTNGYTKTGEALDGLDVWRRER